MFAMNWLHNLLALGLLVLPGAYTQVPNQDALLPEFWPPGPGNFLVPQQPNQELIQMMNELDPNRIDTIITKLVSFGTRHTCSNQTDPNRGIGAARDWIASQMRAIAATSKGRMTVTVPSYIQPATVEGRIPFDTNISNIVATLVGSKDPARTYVIAGHYDSRNTDILDFTNDAPGAGDDASGVAIMMELARIMATHDTASTIIFTAVAGEEEDLFGSNFLATSLKQAGVDVQGMLNNDIVGSPTADDGKTVDPFNIRLFAQGIPPTLTGNALQTTLTIGGENDVPARQLARFVDEVSSNSLTGMTVQIVYRPDRFLRGGDHLSFLQQGYPAVRFTEPHENFAHQHQDVRVVDGVQFGDLTEFVDMNFVTRVGKVNGVALWSLAQAPGTPKNVTLDTSVLTNNSTLSWAKDPLVDGGYEIVWRATDEPQWSRVISVGLTTSAVVQVSKDNVEFGVRAVGKNGFKSPAAYPAPAG